MRSGVKAMHVQLVIEATNIGQSSFVKQSVRRHCTKLLLTTNHRNSVHISQAHPTWIGHLNDGFLMASACVLTSTRNEAYNGLRLAASMMGLRNHIKPCEDEMTSMVASNFECHTSLNATKGQPVCLQKILLLPKLMSLFIWCWEQAKVQAWPRSAYACRHPPRNEHGDEIE